MLTILFQWEYNYINDKLFFCLGMSYMFLRKLGKRGAEMVEYAIVLACIAAVGVGFYSSNDSKLTGVLDGLFGKVRQVLGLENSTTDFNGRFKLDSDDQKYAVFMDSVINGMYTKMLEREPNNIPSEVWIQEDGKIYGFSVYDNENKRDGGYREFDSPVSLTDLLPPGSNYTFSNCGDSHIYFKKNGEITGANDNWGKASYIYLSNNNGTADTYKKGSGTFEACLTFNPSTGTFGSEVDYWKK